MVKIASLSVCLAVLSPGARAQHIQSLPSPVLPWQQAPPLLYEQTPRFPGQRLTLDLRRPFRPGDLEGPIYLSTRETPVRLYIRDETGAPVSDASISVLETRLLLVTNEQGNCTCIAPAGSTKLTLLITRPGYTPVKRIIELPQEGDVPIIIGITPLNDRWAIARIIPCRDNPLY